jgi:hypothetical protein|tara:strand:- start:684 stop:998 length:315 start_codon:yes stop_codon:yes gene_type:complete
MVRIVEKNLNKGHLRKLTALRKSLGPKIANEAFSKWLKEQAKPVAKADPHLISLEKAVARLVKKGLRIPPSGIKITRGRGGISVRKIEMKPRKPRKKPQKRKAK